MRYTGTYAIITCVTLGIIKKTNDEWWIYYMIRYEDMNEKEKHIYQYLSLKPEGATIHDLYSEFKDISPLEVQEVIKRFYKSKMLVDTQGGQNGGCPWLFTLRRF